MGIFANLKLRRKLLFAMAPLAMMAILAAVYSSIEIRTLDDWYSQLVDRDWRAVHHIDIEIGLAFSTTPGNLRLQLVDLIEDSRKSDAGPLADKSSSVETGFEIMH